MLPFIIRVVLVPQARLHSTQLNALLGRYLLFRAGLLSCVSNLPPARISLLRGSDPGGEVAMTPRADRAHGL